MISVGCSVPGVPASSQASAPAAPPDQAIVSSDTANALAAASLTKSFNPAAGHSNTLLVVKVGLQDTGNGSSITGVTYNGVAMAAGPNAFGTDTMVQIFTMASPPTGAHNVVASADSLCNLACVIEFWENVLSVSSHNDAANSIGTLAQATAVSVEASAVVVEATIASGGSTAITLTPDASQSSSGHSNVAFGNSPFKAVLRCSQKAASGSVTMKETVSASKEWSIAAIALRHL